MSDPRDDDQIRRSALDDRTVLGAAPRTATGAMASGGAYDTEGGGDLGGPGRRDPGDSAGDLRPATSREGLGLGRDDPREGAALAKEVFGSDEDTNQDQISDALRREEDKRG